VQATCGGKRAVELWLQVVAQESGRGVDVGAGPVAVVCERAAIYFIVPHQNPATQLPKVNEFLLGNAAPEQGGKESKVGFVCFETLLRGGKVDLVESLELDTQTLGIGVFACRPVVEYEEEFWDSDGLPTDMLVVSKYLGMCDDH
jgi:hypothetical protein